MLRAFHPETETNRPGIGRLRLIILILLPVTLVTLDAADFAPLEWGKAAVRDLLSPVIDAVGSLTSPVSRAWQSVGNYDDLLLENEELREELEQLKGRELEEANARETLSELMREMEIPYVSDIPRVRARVIRQLGNFPSLDVDINKGASSGIVEGMPAVTSAGLVGRVVEVSRSQARIRLITDVNFELGVRIGSSTVAVAKGNGPGFALIVSDGVPLSVPVEPGMVVTTSGIQNSVYPPDIPVGLIQEVRVDPDLDQVLYLQPIASLNSLTFLSVLLYDNEL